MLISDEIYVSVWNYTNETVLIAVYLFVMYFVVRRLSEWSWLFVFLATAIVGGASAVFAWPWMYIIFGWPGASLGAVISQAFGLRLQGLPLAGALISAAFSMAALALGVGALIALPTLVWKKFRRRNTK